MVVKTPNIDENGPPRIPTRLARIKDKLSTPETQGAILLLDEAASKRDDEPAPMPQSDLSLDLKKPRDFAISLLQPRENLNPLGISRHQKPHTLMDQPKKVPLLRAPPDRDSDTGKDAQGDEPAWLNQPFVISGQFEIPGVPSFDSASGETNEEGLHPRYAQDDGRCAVYCQSKVVRWTMEGLPDVPLDAEDFSDDETASEDDIEEDPEPCRILIVTNPDPDPHPILVSFSKSAACGAALADEWGDEHPTSARFSFLAQYVCVQKGSNPYAPWIPSLFNPIRINAPPKTWSMLDAPLKARLGDSQWTMKTPLGEGILRRASRLLCDNDGNNPRHCMACKYDGLQKALLSASFRRQRAARGVLYSYNSCRACFGSLSMNNSRASSRDCLTIVSEEGSCDEALPPRPSVDADKLWAGSLIKGIGLDHLNGFGDDEELAIAATADKDDSRFRPPASPTDEDSDLNSTEDGHQEEATDNRGTLSAHDEEITPLAPEGSTESDSDRGEDYPPPTCSTRLPNKRRRHSSSEPVAPSEPWSEASRPPLEKPGPCGKLEPTKEVRKESTKGSTTFSGRVQKRPRRSSLPPGARPQSNPDYNPLSKEEHKTGLQAILDTFSLTNDDIHLNNGVYHCPLEGCTHTAGIYGDLVRHLQSKRHATYVYLCLDERCLQEFSREDSLKMHHKSNRGIQHRKAHQERVVLGFHDRVRKELIGTVKKRIGETLF